MNEKVKQFLLRKPKDKIPGGLADNKTLPELAEKHNIKIDYLIKQLATGVKIELEHSPDKEIAKEIAMDHLFEDPKYYIKLKKVEGDTK